MDDLVGRKCEACRTGAPQATQADIDALMPKIPKWEIIEVDGIKRLRRTVFFSNFEEALTFTNKVGAIAEQENHHPAILTEWGKVTVTWWTHKIRGLHINDFVLAAKTDSLV